MTLETARTREITTSEMERDILDTQQEIAVMEGELKAYEMIPRESSDYRMAQLRADYRRDGIGERRVFIDKLRAIIAERQSVSSQRTISDE